MPAPNPPPPNEADHRFPSGPWEGYFQQRSVSVAKGTMELDLTFRAGRVTGGGRDGVGPFRIAGGYDTAEGKVWWTKSYPFHTVFYRGFAESKGIWGTWEIARNDRDGFHIWPKGSGEGESERKRREESPPVTFEEDAFESEPLVSVHDSP